MKEIKKLLNNKDYLSAKFLLYKTIKSSPDTGSLLKYTQSFTFSDSETTCRINLREKYVKIGTKFFIDYIETLEDVLFLLFHERNHLILDKVFGSDTRCSDPKLQNFVEDFYINAVVSNQINSDLPTRFFKDREPNLSLLTPKVHPDVEEPLKEIHKRLYSVYKKRSTDSYTYEQYMKDINDTLVSKEEDKMRAHSSLLGCLEKEGLHSLDSHADEEEEFNNEHNAKVVLIPDVHNELAIIFSDLNITKDIISDYRKRISETPRFNLDSLYDTMSKIISKNSVERPYFHSTIIPTYNNKSSLFNRAFNTEVLYKDSFTYENENRYALYMDVSQSMDIYYSLIFKIRDFFRDNIDPDNVFVFSTFVEKTTLEADRFVTSGATDFNIVAQSFIDNDIKKAIVITDNEERIFESYSKYLNSMEDLIIIATTTEDRYLRYCDYKTAFFQYATTTVPIH